MANRAKPSGEKEYRNEILTGLLLKSMMNLSLSKLLNVLQKLLMAQDVCLICSQKLTSLQCPGIHVWPNRKFAHQNVQPIYHMISPISFTKFSQFEADEMLFTFEVQN